jgi:hypothetical protein
MQALSTRNRAKSHLILPPHQSKPLNPSQWEAAMQGTTDRWWHQSKGEKSDESEADTCASHGSYGPQTCPNHLQTPWTPRTDLRTHLIATSQKHTVIGAHRGSADPTGRPNRPCGCQWAATMWCLLVGSSSILGVLTPFSRSCPEPINRCEGVRIGHTLLLHILPLGSYLSRRGVPLHRISAGLLVLRD